MTVGNDIVDLDDPECRLESLHPRWVERVFHESERAALARASDASPAGPSPWSERHRLLWALWAAKESAFKAVKRIDPGAVFAPRDLVVELPALPPGGAVAGGSVRRRDHALAVEVRIDAGRVHAVAVSAGAGRRVISSIASADADPSLAVRRLAVARIGRALALDPRSLEVTDRPPVVRRERRPLDICLSLSHHGRFVAFAGMVGADATLSL